MQTLKDYGKSITIRLPDSSPSGRYVHLIDFIATTLENDPMVANDTCQCICAYAKTRFTYITRNI